jgi:UDP-glucose 4-epimerase
VVGIDTREPHYDLGRADFLKLDIRHSLIGKLVRSVGIDTVLHTSTTIDSFDLDPRRAHETNVIGTLNLLAGCAGEDSPVRRIVLKSSAHVYGARHDQPAYLREDRRLDADSPHAFVRDVVEVESYIFDYAVRNPTVEVLILRFANSLNADEPQPLARYLDLDLVPTVIGFDPVLQLIHSDDCVEALRRGTLRGAAGAYNIAAPNPLPVSRLLDRVGKMHAPLIPPLGLGLSSQVLRRLGIAFLSPQLLDLLRFGRTLDTDRAASELGFRAARDTAAALEDFTQQRRVIRFMPDQRSYLYEKELEDFIHSRAVRLHPVSDGQPANGGARSRRPRRRSPEPLR